MPGNPPNGMYFTNGNGGGYPPQQMSSSMDQQYWRNIFSVLGFGREDGNNSAIPQFPANSHVRGTPYDNEDMSAYQQIPQATSHSYIN